MAQHPEPGHSKAEALTPRFSDLLLRDVVPRFNINITNMRPHLPYSANIKDWRASHMGEHKRRQLAEFGFQEDDVWSGDTPR